VAATIEGWRWDGELKRDVYLASSSDVGKKLSLDPSSPNSVGRWLSSEDNKVRIQQHLTRYFTADYSGRHFEWFCSQSPSSQFGPWDVLAIEALSVGLPPQTVRWLLEPDLKRDTLLDRAHQLVAEDKTLWECDINLLRRGGALSDLYDLLRDEKGLGYVTTSKLMAAKFPRLVPIRDSRVEVLLNMKGQKEWWEPIRSLFADNNCSLAMYLNEEFDVPPEIGEVTTLRRLDVILWMESRARDQLPREALTAETQRES